MEKIKAARPGSERGLCAQWEVSLGAPRTPVQTHTAGSLEMGLVAHSRNPGGVRFSLSISTLPCRLGEGSHALLASGGFPEVPFHGLSRCLLQHLEWKCHASKDTTPTHMRQEQPGERLARAGGRLGAFYKLPGRNGLGESYLSTQEAGLGYIMSQGQPGLHSETVSNK